MDIKKEIDEYVDNICDKMKNRINDEVDNYNQLNKFQMTYAECLMNDNENFDEENSEIISSLFKRRLKHNIEVYYIDKHKELKIKLNTANNVLEFVEDGVSLLKGKIDLFIAFKNNCPEKLGKFLEFYDNVIRWYEYKHSKHESYEFDESKIYFEGIDNSELVN